MDTLDEQQLKAWFQGIRDMLEPAYLSAVEPWQQSGFSGPEDRWKALRKPIADCVDKSGTFLDIGCANGYFLECLMRWTDERGLQVEPFGLDLSDKIAALARIRLSKYARNIYVGNCWGWSPPKRFDYVRTELLYVPQGLERLYMSRLLHDFLLPAGKLLVTGYIPRRQRPELTDPRVSQQDRVPETLTNLGFPVQKVVWGVDASGHKGTVVAVIPAFV